MSNRSILYICFYSAGYIIMWAFHYFHVMKIMLMSGSFIEFSIFKISKSINYYPAAFLILFQKTCVSTNAITFFYLPITFFNKLCSSYEQKIVDFPFSRIIIKTSLNDARTEFLIIKLFDQN